MAMEMTSLSRRGILKMAAGALVVRFALGQSSSDASKPLNPADVDSFIAVHADGSVTSNISKGLVCTGLATAYHQTAAVVHDILVEHLSVVDVDAELAPDHGGTGESIASPR